MTVARHERATNLVLVRADDPGQTDGTTLLQPVPKNHPVEVRAAGSRVSCHSTARISADSITPDTGIRPAVVVLPASTLIRLDNYS